MESSFSSARKASSSRVTNADSSATSGARTVPPPTQVSASPEKPTTRRNPEEMRHTPDARRLNGVQESPSHRPQSYRTDSSDTASGLTPRILVVDDDVVLSEMLQLILTQEGFTTFWCGSGSDALDAVHETNPDIVLLDVMLPGRDGITVASEIRAHSPVPIIMLTAKGETSDIVAGLEAGADDYVVKPFRSKELLARIAARLRRREPSEDELTTLTIGAITIDTLAHTVMRAGEAIALTPLEFELLATLARHPEKVFTRDELLRDVWGYEHHAVDNRLVNVHVQRLRTKIEDDPDNPTLVLTIRGVGYRAGQPEV